MKTTSVRKLLPEAWGFLCPVHTPDGAPCGLLNHLAAMCIVAVGLPDTSRVADALADVAPTFIDTRQGLVPVSGVHVPVVLDGRALGVIPSKDLTAAAWELRHLKVRVFFCLLFVWFRESGGCARVCPWSCLVVVLPSKMFIPYVCCRFLPRQRDGIQVTGDERVPVQLEIACVTPLDAGVGTFPGLFLFSQPSRFMRPVMNLVSAQPELIGSLEQVWLATLLRLDAGQMCAAWLDLNLEMLFWS